MDRDFYQQHLLQWYTLLALAGEKLLVRHKANS